MIASGRRVLRHAGAAARPFLALGARRHVRRHARSGGHRARGDAEDATDLDRDAVESTPARHRHRRLRRASRPRCGAKTVVDNTWADAGPAAAVHAWRRSRDALDHQVSRRPQRRAGRRRHRARKRRVLRARAGDSGRRRRGAVAVRLLAGAARHPVAAVPHARPCRGRAPARGVPGGAARRSSASTFRGWRRIRAMPSRRGRCATLAGCCRLACAAGARRRSVWRRGSSWSRARRVWAAPRRSSSTARRSKATHSKAPENLLRISVGLEHPDDLIDDFRQALAPGLKGDWPPPNGLRRANSATQLVVWGTVPPPRAIGGQSPCYCCCAVGGGTTGTRRSYVGPLRRRRRRLRAGRALR